MKAAILCAAACLALPAAADEAREARLQRLEKTFWFCDYAATTRGPRTVPVAACNAASDELKREKFAGDFRRFLAWWRERKEAEHGRIARLPKGEAAS